MAKVTPAMAVHAAANNDTVQDSPLSMVQFLLPMLLAKESVGTMLVTAMAEIGDLHSSCTSTQSLSSPAAILAYNIVRENHGEAVDSAVAVVDILIQTGVLSPDFFDLVKEDPEHFLAAVLSLIPKPRAHPTIAQALEEGSVEGGVAQIDH